VNTVGSGSAMMTPSQRLTSPQKPENVQYTTHNDKQRKVPAMAMDSIRNEREQQSGLALKVPAHGRPSKHSEVELRDAGSLT